MGWMVGEGGGLGWGLGMGCWVRLWARGQGAWAGQGRVGAGLGGEEGCRGVLLTNERFDSPCLFPVFPPSLCRVPTIPCLCLIISVLLSHSHSVTVTKPTAKTLRPSHPASQPASPHRPSAPLLPANALPRRNTLPSITPMTLTTPPTMAQSLVSRWESGGRLRWTSIMKGERS